MIFSRRKPLTRWRKLAETLWPKMGWRRVMRYYRLRASRLPGTPRAIATGFATGIAISFTPFIGIHLMLGAILSWMLGGSLVAMALGTIIAGNPWTFPLIWITTYRLGYALMGEYEPVSYPETLDHQFLFSDLLHKPLELLLPMTIGSIPFCLVFGFLSFFLARKLVRRSREDRKARMDARTRDKT